MPDKYNSADSYVMNELKEAHQQLQKYQDDLFNAAKKIRTLETQLTNQNEYIIELENKLGLTGDV